MKVFVLSKFRHPNLAGNSAVQVSEPSFRLQRAVKKAGNCTDLGTKP
jgi:hypothetical protein